MFIKKENIKCSMLSDDSILYSQSYDLMNFGSILNYKAPMRLHINLFICIINYICIIYTNLISSSVFICKLSGAIENNPENLK